MYDEILELLRNNTTGLFTAREAKQILNDNRYNDTIEEVAEILEYLVKSGYLDFYDFGDSYKYKVI